MRFSLWSIIFACLALVACSGSSPRHDGAQRQDQVVAPASLAPTAGPKRIILAFGDSLFAGHGVGLDRSYPAQLQAALRRKGINVEIVNAGVSGDTSAAGRARLAFTLDAQQHEPDLVLLELGANDMLRGLSPDQTRANMAAMLEELKKRKIPVLLMGMRAPPNYGGQYREDFDSIYPDLAEKYGAQLIPFWLESIYRRPELFLPDHLHPTVKGIGVLVDSTEGAVEKALPSSKK